MGFDPGSESVGLWDCLLGIWMEKYPHATFITQEVLRSDRSVWLPKLALVTGMVSLCGCDIPRTGSQPWSL